MKNKTALAVAAFLLPLAACLCYRQFLSPAAVLAWGEVRARFAETIVTRLLCALSVVVLMRRASLPLFAGEKTPAVYPAFGVSMMVALNNLPFSAWIGGRAGLSACAGDVLFFAAVCLAVALFEELLFRGFLLPVIRGRFGPGRKGRFFAVLLSAAVFALFHLLNLLGGADPLAVVLQVGYSFLVGGMTGALYLLCGNIWLPVIVHAVYNFCGLLLPELGWGDVRMDGATVAVTAAVALCAAVVLSRLLWRQKE